MLFCNLLSSRGQKGVQLLLVKSLSVRSPEVSSYSGKQPDKQDCSILSLKCHWSVTYKKEWPWMENTPWPMTQLAGQEKKPLALSSNFYGLGESLFLIAWTSSQQWNCSLSNLPNCITYSLLLPFTDNHPSTLWLTSRCRFFFCGKRC